MLAFFIRKSFRHCTLSGMETPPSTRQGPRLLALPPRRDCSATVAARLPPSFLSTCGAGVPQLALMLVVLTPPFARAACLAEPSLVLVVPVVVVLAPPLVLVVVACCRSTPALTPTARFDRPWPLPCCKMHVSSVSDVL
jgi:hypothetical protein